MFCFTVTWQDKRDGDYEVYFTSVKCCGNDVDADTVDSCTDCNDLDGTVHPGATEICDFQDNDCDTVIDEGYLIPGPVAGLELALDGTMSWIGLPEADRYDVIKGRTQTLWSGSGDFSSAVRACSEDDSPDLTSVDPEWPLPNETLFYLIRSQNFCKDGTWDSSASSQVGERDAEIEDSGFACP